jgi:hypothetical protein
MHGRFTLSQLCAIAALDDEPRVTAVTEFPAISGFPTAFTLTSTSADGLASGQGVAFDPALNRFYATGGAAGVNSRAIFAYDSSYNQLASSGELGVAQGLPSGTSQVNGITWWGGKLYAGYNNYSTTPKTGGIIVVNPANLTVIEAIHPATNGHVEGCAIRMTQRGAEAFVFSNSSRTIERYDLATWTLQGSHEFGGWAVGASDAQYQGGGWYGDCLCLGLHGSQLRPKMIDVCQWDDDALTFTPLYRMGRPTVWAAQGFNYASPTKAFFAERQTDVVPDVYRIANVGVSSVASLPHSTPNVASSQLTNLQYWYQHLTSNGAATPAFQLVDSRGNGTTGTGFDGSRVYPVVTSDGTRKMRFDGEDGSSIALGNLFGAGWSLATIWMRGVTVYRNDANDTVFSFDASGTNLGDGVIEVNRTNARSISFRYSATTVTSPGDVFTLGVPFDLCIQLTASGVRIYVNGNQVASNALAGQIGGIGQACYLGSNLLGTAGAQFDVWDVRLYNAVIAPATLANYDMWTD